MACGCNGGGNAPALRWTVDLNVPGVTAAFADGSKKKTYATPAEANSAVITLGLAGKVRPRPATAGE